MNAATEFDVGPLTWVKSEIDLALDRADRALQQYSDDAGDLTQIKFCRTHLHQVQGALTIVGLDGVTQFAEAVEALLDSVEHQEAPAAERSVVLARQSLSAIGHYLDGLINGQPNQPLRFLSLYREVQAQRGLQRVSATDLFYPDLSAKPPKRDAPARKLASGDIQRRLRQERIRFQRGLLAWLLSPEDRSGVKEMLKAVNRIEETQDSGAARSFWWVARGLLTALAEGKLPEETNVKQLCARIDLQIRRLLEGSRNVAERLMRDALYYVASADSDDTTVTEVKQTYHLEGVIPEEGGVAPAPEETVLRKLHDILAATEEAWNKYCAGTTQALSVFKENALALSAIVERLGHTDYRRLAQAIVVAANWLAEDASRHSDALAMEVATAILLSLNAQENFQKLGSDFAHQVDVTVARIHACIAGNPPLPGSEIPLLDEMSRQAQEKLLVGHVAKEMQSNLTQIEQVLDGFFRDSEKRSELVGLQVPLRQVVGALTMMRHDAAVAALQECAAEIRRFAEPEYVPLETDFERVANQLSLIGFFIDSMQHGNEGYEAFARRVQAGPHPENEVPEEGETGATIEQEVEQQKLEAHALLGALKEQPGDVGLREEVRLNLEALKNDADLVADTALGEKTEAVLTALETGEDASPHIEQAMATLRPPFTESLRPSDETLLLSLASTEEIDAELLGIFLEEANEVLGTIDENLRSLKDQPHNMEYLTTIRRSFHTLKGSGRMVGLRDVGEAAWAIEQTLNLWLRLELEVGSSLLELLDQAQTVFSAWVRYLETREDSAPDPASMVLLAEKLRRHNEAKESGEVQLVMSPQEEEVPAEPATAETMPEEAGGAAGEPAEEVVQEEPRGVPPEEPQRSAEIIQVDFAPVSPAQEETLAEIEIAEVEANAGESGVPLAEASPMEDLSGSEPEKLVVKESESGESLPDERKQRISVTPALYEIFFDEASAHLETLRRELHVLEGEEPVPTPYDMYRAAHTLAGISSTLGLVPLNQLGHALEHALLRRDNSALPGSLEALGVIRRSIGELELMLSAIAVQRDIEVPFGLIQELESLYPVNLQTPSEEPVAAEAGKVEAEAEAEAPEAPVERLPAETAVPVPAIPVLRDDIDEQLLPIFLEEAVDLNQGITAQLRAWRDDPGNFEVVRTLARLLHTLKGSARMAGAMNLGEITHALETRVDQVIRVEKTARELTGEIDEIDSTFDSILQIIERLQRGESLEAPAVQPALESVEPVAVAASSPEPEAAPEKAIQAVPVNVERRRDRMRTHEAETDVTQQRATLRIRADVIDRLSNEAGELSIARSRIEGEMRSLKESLLDLTENVIRLRRQLREVEIQAESQMQSRTAMADEPHAGFDPLEFDRFTRFQELTRMMAESVNDVATVQQNLLKNLDDANAAIIAQARLNREVQQELMSVRMIPFNSLADRMYRIVRQTSKELNKRANLEISGGQVELDRSVLDKIAAPLEHMLRNAIAHGLEDRGARLARGKPEIGDISLSLKQEGNEVILALSDDGAGLDFDRIRARGLESGLLGANEEADPERLANLIFSPGFSTAEEISQVAGRGVGMDVVKTEVTSLGGRIEISSSPGQGTEFRVIIPLTLAVTKALLVRAGNKSYAIPSAMIEQVLDLKETALSRIREAGSAEWMGHHYPFDYLPHMLGDSGAVPEQQRQYWILLLRSGSRRISVQVDELQGNEEIVVKNIGPQLMRVIGVDGATVLGNGQVVLILNPVALSTRSPVEAQAVLETPEAGKAAPVALPTVMVVDDSLTVRKITGRLLAREGYHVLSAKDGVDALEQLLDVVPDVMLVDIEMPRMDGFDLTRNIRADARLKDVPIIMITSRTADKHRNYAFEVGVNHYLGKPYQEEELLHLVAGYVSRHRQVS